MAGSSAELQSAARLPPVVSREMPAGKLPARRIMMDEPGGVGVCPVCRSAHRRASARFCGHCGHDFQSAAARAGALWMLAGEVDVSLRGKSDPWPTDYRSLAFAMTEDPAVIGRTVPGEDIDGIAIDDPGISRRHAEVARKRDGSLVVRDLESTNGTKVNGNVLEPNMWMPLQEGDCITLGCWTRLTVQTR